MKKGKKIVIRKSETKDKWETKKRTMGKNGSHKEELVQNRGGREFHFYEKIIIMELAMFHFESQNRKILSKTVGLCRMSILDTLWVHSLICLVAFDD